MRNVCYKNKALVAVGVLVLAWTIIWIETGCAPDDGGKSGQVAESSLQKMWFEICDKLVDCDIYSGRGGELSCQGFYDWNTCDSLFYTAECSWNECLSQNLSCYDFLMCHLSCWEEYCFPY